MFLKASKNSETHVISETEFAKLCDDLYRDRYRIYQYNPRVSSRDALLWMLTGCLMSLLSVRVTEQSVSGGSSSDLYGDAVCEILRGRTQPPFDPRPHLARLSEKLASEET